METLCADNRLLKGSLKMSFTVEKASMWKRISAYLFDIILVITLAVGIGTALSAVTGYDGYNDTFFQISQQYEEQYGVKFEVTAEEWEKLTQAEIDQYNTAYEAFTKNEEAMYAYNMIISLMMVITSVSVLLAYLVWEFALPLWLKNGQTLGKKVFNIGLVRSDGVRVTPFMMFVRTVLGKYTIETMIPLLVGLMIFFGTIGVVGPTIVLILLVIQLVLVFASHNKTAIHDFIAHTVVVDLSSQLVFDTPEELVAYKQKIAAEKAAKQDY
jgi:uncharacterized RDD family membrane protein YckC